MGKGELQGPCLCYGSVHATCSTLKLKTTGCLPSLAPCELFFSNIAVYLCVQRVDLCVLESKLFPSIVA